MASLGPTTARWPDGVLLTGSRERRRARAQDDSGDARLDALEADGGEPRALDELVAAAKRAGFDRIVVQQDTEPPRPWDRLRAAGLTGVSLRAEGGDEGLHDFIAAQEPDATLPTLDAIDRLAQDVRRAGLELHVRTRVARSNFRSLGGVLARALAWGAKTWTLEYLPLSSTELPPQGVGHVHPRLSLSLPWALHCGARAVARGLCFALRGAPLCLLGPLAKHAVLEEAGGFGPACAGCPARTRCVGADPTYLERFGSGELRPRPYPGDPSLGWWSVAPLLPDP